MAEDNRVHSHSPQSYGHPSRDASRNSFAPNSQRNSGAMPPPSRPAPIDPPLLSSFNDPSVPSTPPAWDAIQFHTPIASRLQYPLDIRIDDLSDPAARSSAPQPDHTDNQDPLTRFYAGRDDPWIPQQSLPPYTTMPVLSQRPLTSHPRSTAPDLTAFDHHSSAPSSEVGSSVALPSKADSGYITKPTPTTRSMHSHESGETNELSTRLDNMYPYSGHMRPPRQGVNHFPGSQQHVLANQGMTASSLICRYCGEAQKCRSDFKKHVTRHEKPHKCDVPGCTRKEGFTSANDLDRHKKSKHNIAPTHGSDRSYKCAAEQCKKKSKIWPRLDNFRQHVLKIHPDENADVLIRKSEELAAKSRTENTFTAAKTQPTDVLNPPPATNHTQSVQQLAPITYDPSPTPHTRHYPQGPMWTLPSQPGGSNNQQRSLSTSALARPNSTSNGVADTHATAQWTSLPPAQPTPLPTQIKQRVNSDGLNALANAAVNQWQPPNVVNGEQPMTNGGWTSPELMLSPQHSLDPEAKQALTVLSRMLAEKTKSSKKIIEKLDAVKSVLDEDAYEQSDPGDAQAIVSPEEEDEVQIRVENILARLIGNDTPKPRSSSGRQKANGTSGGEQCNVCFKTVPRNCELNKHMKRHTRPYGCTFPRCKKKFGSKNDWKRHENSQHFQQETYRCRCPDANGQECCQLLYSLDNFRNHLTAAHAYTEEQVKVECSERHIGRNGQGRFWCGFCKTVLKLEQRGIEAWDERFKHIGDHFNKDCYDIKDWLCLETNKPKGLQAKELSRELFDYPDAADKQQQPPQQPVPGMHPAPVPADYTNGDGGASSTSRKRPRSETVAMNGPTWGSGRGQETVMFCGSADAAKGLTTTSSTRVVQAFP
ncbi:MAG: hypothetical protein M1821_002769 [Bathelium mastoideum]|nr:MAG: hypothetical protein M1821_002769 [Bathelium mastoideum]